MQSSTATYQGLDPSSGKPVTVSVRDGKISSVESCATPQTHWISPGFIDVQVNGFVGVDYNSPATTTDDITRSIEAQRKTGVTTLLPTVITNSLDDMAACLANLAAAKSQLSAIAGFHVEGPWISPDDGPRGAHPVEHVRPASVDEFRRLQDAAQGHIRLLTLAPESPNTLALIDHAVRSGVVVSIGHTGATAQQINDAVSAGATMTTHLGNGAHSVLPKTANYVLQQMADDRLHAGLIVDGIHLPPHFVKIALRTKGLDRSVLVTDAVAPAGCEPGVHRLGSLEVRLSDDGKVQLANGRLAGSSLHMHNAVANVMRFAGITLYEALRLATVNAASAVRLTDRTGFLQPGDPAELVHLEHSADGDIHILETIV